MLELEGQGLNLAVVWTLIGVFALFAVLFLVFLQADTNRKKDELSRQPSIQEQRKTYDECASRHSDASADWLGVYCGTRP